MTVGFHWHYGKTIIDAWDVFPSYVELFQHEKNGMSGYFFQILVNFNKIDIGLEVGKAELYDIGGFYPVDNIYYGLRFHQWREKYKPLRLLSIIQFKLTNSLIAQSGIGVLTDGPNHSQIGPYLNLMASLRYHLKLLKWLELPTFIRADWNSSPGTPFSFSIGAGLMIHWKVIL